MGRRKKYDPPVPRLHKASGRYFVRCSMLFGSNPKYLPGRPGEREFSDCYQKIVQQFHASIAEENGQQQDRESGGDGGKTRSPLPTPQDIQWLCGLFLNYSQRRHGKEDYDHYRRAVGVLIRRHGRILVENFTAPDLIEVQSAFAKETKKIRSKGKIVREVPWSRQFANRQTNRVKGIFRWGVGKGYVPASVYAALEVVSPLEKGEVDAPETKKKEPVAWVHVKAVIDDVAPHVATLIEVHWLTGARPKELCDIRRVDILREGEVWVHQLDGHKNRWRGHERAIYFGPKCRALLERYMDDGDDREYLFSPRVAMLEYAESWRRKNGPVSVSSKIGEKYNSRTYRQAVVGAIERLNRDRRKAGEPEIEFWTPGQIRHSTGTILRDKFGLEFAQAYLGHARLETTQIYARVQKERAIEIAKAEG